MKTKVPTAKDLKKMISYFNSDFADIQESVDAVENAFNYFDNGDEEEADKIIEDFLTDHKDDLSRIYRNLRRICK